MVAVAVESTKTRHTLADYRPFLEKDDESGRQFELIDGEIVERMGSFEPSRIAANILGFISLYLKQNNIGTVTGADGTYGMSETNAFIPDVAYITHSRLSDVPTRAVPVPPDLAVEVKPPADSTRAMRRKAERYLELGTKLVWLVFPDGQTVEVYAGEQDVQTVTIAGTLVGSDVLPGFALTVADIFKR